MVATPDRQEPNKRNLHTSKCAQSEPSRVADIQPGTVAPHADKHKGV